MKEDVILTLSIHGFASDSPTPTILPATICDSVVQGVSREINYQLFSLISIYIYCETEYVRVFSYVSYVWKNASTLAGRPARMMVQPPWMCD